MDNITLLGLTAGTLTTISFIPQLVKSLRTKSTQDLSLWMYLIFTTGIFLWFVYGLLRKDIPVIAANAVALVITTSILVIKLRYR